MKKSFLAMAFAVLTGLALGSQALAAEVTLRAATAVPQSSKVAQVFLEYVKLVNERGKGVVQIQYIGGPEVTPPAQQPAALERGLIDILHTPGSFYAGQVKEVDALLASNLSIAEMRKNGAMDMLNTLWRESLNAQVLGWFDTTVAFHMYLAQRPKMTADGGVDLSGIRMFTTPTYREFQEALGATPVAMAIGEIQTSLDRGLIQGYGWPDYGIAGLGFDRLTKYRIDPTYYRGNVMAIANAKKWDSLSPEARNILMSVAMEWEVKAADFIGAEKAKELATLKASGMEIIALQGAAAQKYRQTAHDIAWKRLAERSPSQATKLRQLMYDPSR